MDTFLLPPQTHFVNVAYQGAGSAQAYDSLSFIGLCAFDPNDKIAAPEGIGAMHQVGHGQLLDYTIRFQNYGNDTAFYVLIVDTLDPSLDFNTFAYKASSHLCNVELHQNGVLKVRFPMINLLWESLNAAASQGFFRYSIKPRSNLSDGTMITNDAAIYFDFNQGITTNVVFHTLTTNPVAVPEIHDGDGWSVYPVPASGQIFVRANDESTLSRLHVLDLTGRTVMVILNHDMSSPVDISGLKPGVYFIEAEKTNLKKKHLKFVVERPY